MGYQSAHRARDQGQRLAEIWRPQPGPQQLLLECPVPDVLFGGARGGGKSDAILGDWVEHASRGNGWARGIIFRRTMPELEEIISRSRQLYPLLGAEWSAGKKMWTFPCGATLKMRWLDRDEDADRYQGHSYDYVAIDEAGTWPSPAPIDKLRATMRSTHRIPCVMRLTANPGGIGQQWLTERYIKPSPAGVPFYDEARKTWRVFIPSRLKDNRKLVEADPGYEDRLRSSGPPWLVRAWLEGDWTASSGQAFFDEICLLADGLPVETPAPVDYVFATIDTAVKTGKEHDGTACVYWGYNRFLPVPLYILDWDIIQVEGAMLEVWLPSVYQRLEQLAQKCRARMGSQGTYIEDKNSGMVLIQQAQRRGYASEGIDSKLASMGKEERAISVSGYVYQGLVKITREAYDKTVTYKGETRNHFISQFCGFRVGLKDQPDDLLDCGCYGVALSLGDSDMW